MSSWTYITGTVTVSLYGSGQHVKTFVLNEVLDHLPLVPGSEGPMTWQVLQLPGYSSSCNADEFGMRTNLNRYERFSYMWETQDTYVIVLDGKLRDTCYEDTLRAFVAWLNRLSKRISVEDMLVRVTGLKRGYGSWGERIFSGTGCWGGNCMRVLRDARENESLRTRRSTNWRYELMPESQHWPDILVNLLPGGHRLAFEHDLLLGNCELEEYLEYDHKTGKYGGVEPDISKLFAEARDAVNDRDGMLQAYLEEVSDERP